MSLNKKVSGTLDITVNGVQHEIKFTDTPLSSIQALYEFMQNISGEAASQARQYPKIAPRDIWGYFDTGPWQAIMLDNEGDNAYDVTIDEN